MRDWAILILVVVMVGLSLRNAFSMYVLWGWAGLIGLPNKMYGFMASFPFVLIFALLCLIMILLRRDPKMRPMRMGGLQLLFVLMGLQALLSATFAFDGLARNWEIAIDLLKTLLYALLMSAFVTSRFRAHVMTLMIVLAMGYFGAIEGLKFVASGGMHISQGDSRLGDNNHFAVLVGMTIPLGVYVYTYSASRLTRAVAMGLVLASTLSVVTTYSRGGLMALLAMALWMVLRGRRKVVSLLAVAVLATTVVAVAPDAWINRMSSIKSADSDSSFMGRVKAWKRASAIALDRPLNGGGFQSVQNFWVYEKYRFSDGILGFVQTEPATYPAAAHSIYFEALGDMGFVGLALFLMIMLSPFAMLSRVKRHAAVVGPSANWAVDLCVMISIGMTGYLVGGGTISAAHFELGYIFVALAAAVTAMIKTQALSLKAPETAQAGVGARGLIQALAAEKTLSRQVLQFGAAPVGPMQVRPLP